MNRPFESFDAMNRAWDVRFLETHSLRSAFVWLLLDVFMLGAVSFMMLYQGFRQHRLEMTSVALLILFSLNLVRIAPVIYRRLHT